MRELQPLHLQRSPLVFVLAQVRFAPILKMKDFIPEIQERLRKGGFPQYEIRAIQEIAIGSTLVAKQNERWFFADRKKTSAVILTDDFVVLTTSIYATFDKFSETLEAVVKVVRQVCAPDYASRLGLRYVDLVRPSEGESYDIYLRGGLRGLKAEDLGVQSTTIQSHLLAETAEGMLSLRLWQNRERRVLPPDLNGDEVVLQVDEPNLGELLTILDIDHFSERQRDFREDDLIAAMWRLHNGCDRAFRASVTEHALSHWGQEN